LTKNAKERARARCELQRNFEGNDSPGSIDLSARLSFAKCAREVKAANEMAVFKGDYPWDDKSIADDERPNRRRVSESPRTYRKSIPEYGKEINGDGASTLCFIDEDLEHQSGITSDTYDDRRDVTRPKIRRKRISRGVQHNVSAGQGQSSRPFFDYFRPRRKKKGHNPPEEIGEREILKGERIIRILPRNEADRSLSEEIIGGDRRFKGNHNICYNKKGKYQRDNTVPEMPEDLKGNNRKVKKSSFDRFITILTCKNIPKMQQYVPSTDDDSPKDQRATIEQPSNSKSTRTSGECKNASPRSEKLQANVFRRANDSNNAQTARGLLDSGDESDVNEAKKKLECCIAELNEIISDACVIFGSKRAQCRGLDAVRVTRVCE